MTVAVYAPHAPAPAPVSVSVLGSGSYRRLLHPQQDLSSPPCACSCAESLVSVSVSRGVA